MEDKKRKNVSYLSKIPRESTSKILENVIYPYNNNIDKRDWY